MFVSSIGLHFGFIPFQYLMYDKHYLLQFPPQVWRLATGFLITGPELGLLFDTYFFYQAASHMETGHPRVRGRPDFIWYLICICCFIVVSLAIATVLFVYVLLCSFWALSAAPHISARTALCLYSCHGSWK